MKLTIVFLSSKKSAQKCKYLKNGTFNIFKGLSISRTCYRPESGPSNFNICNFLLLFRVLISKSYTQKNQLNQLFSGPVSEELFKGTQIRYYLLKSCCNFLISYSNVKYFIIWSCIDNSHRNLVPNSFTANVTKVNWRRCYCFRL